MRIQIFASHHKLYFYWEILLGTGQVGTVFLHLHESIRSRYKSREFRKSYFIAHSGKEDSRNVLLTTEDAPTLRRFF